MANPTRPSAAPQPQGGVNPILWIVVLAVVAAVAFLGFRSNQKPQAASAPAAAPAPAPEKQDPNAVAPPSNPGGTQLPAGPQAG